MGLFGYSHLPNKDKTPVGSFNILFLKRLKWLIRLSAKGRPGWIDPFLLVLIVLSSIIEQVAVYVIGQTVGTFYRAIVQEDLNIFFLAVLWSAGCMLIATLCSSLGLLCSGYLGVRWRQQLVRAIHSRYLGGSKLDYYRIHFESELDNPDQRITQDVDRWSQTLALMFVDLLTAPVVVLYYTFYTLIRLGWIAPLSVYIYFVIGAVVNRAAVKPIVPVVFEQERLEGNFRFTHMRIRTHAECVAFFRGEPHEQQLANADLDAVVSNRKLIIDKEFILNTSTKGFAYVGSLINYAVIACVIFFMTPTSVKDDSSGQLVEFVSQTATGCLMLVSGFTSVIQLSSNWSDLAGYTARVAELLEFLGKQDHVALCPPARFIDDSTTVALENVTCLTPDGRIVAKNLSFSVQLPQQNLLIRAPSGSGKSTILRVLAGLWHADTGTVRRPPHLGYKGIFYLPQKPYLPTGCLRDLVQYPCPAGSWVPTTMIDNVDFVGTRSENDTRVIRCILKDLDLIGLIDRLSSDEDNGLDSPHVVDWTQVLSPGEQQRLCIARLLYHNPAFAVLDESTSSLDVNAEINAYTLLEKHGIVSISVGHRDTLKYVIMFIFVTLYRQFHSLVLILDGHGGWTLTSSSS